MVLENDEQPDISGKRMTNLFFTTRRSHNVGEILGGGNFGRGYFSVGWAAEFAMPTNLMFRPWL